MIETNAQKSTQLQPQPTAQAASQVNTPNNQAAQANNGVERQMANFTGHKASQNARISEILTALMGFSYSEVSIRSVSGVMQKYLGDNWRASVYDCLAAIDEEQYNAAVKKLDELFTYENALAAWGEAIGYSQNPQAMYSVNMVERLEALEYWLKFFGEEGINLYSKVRAAYESLDGNKNGSSDKNQFMEQAENVLQEAQAVQGEVAKPTADDAKEEFSNVLKGLVDVDRDLLWQFNYFLELCSYYDRTMARVAARCVRKQIKMEQYEYIKYAFDVLGEMVELGQKIAKNPESRKICDRVIDGGVDAFNKMIKYYAEELSNVSGEEEVLEADMLNVDGRQAFVESLGFVDRVSEDGVADASAEEKKAIKDMAKEDEKLRQEAEKTPLEKDEIKNMSEESQSDT